MSRLAFITFFLISMVLISCGKFKPVDLADTQEFGPNEPEKRNPSNNPPPENDISLKVNRLIDYNSEGGLCLPEKITQNYKLSHVTIGGGHKKSVSTSQNFIVIGGVYAK